MPASYSAMLLWVSVDIIGYIMLSMLFSRADLKWKCLKKEPNVITHFEAWTLQAEVIIAVCSVRA